MASSLGVSFDAAWGALAGSPLVTVWLFGAVVGLLLPRPKWRATAVASAPGFAVFLRNIVLGWHAVIILREFWKLCTHPGTFRALCRATTSWLCGNGFSFQWPAHSAAAPSAACKAEASSSERIDNWYVGDKDLAFFKYHAVEGGPCEGATPWQRMMDKDIPGFVRYTSWRRTLPSGKTEYKSVTISPNATAREFSDLYLDDDFRRNWDGMVYHHEVLEHGDFSQRQQVVRWMRRFPFAFLSDREYTIARREFKEEDGSIYACTKAVAGHPREARDSSVVKMDVFWSMWRSRTVADPWGGDSPACETVLLHHEQFKIPENLARFAVKHGMWGFVKKLASTVPLYVEARRKRAAPEEDDPEAYGAGEAPNPPMRHSDSAYSLASIRGCGDAGSECGSDDSASVRHGHLAGGSGAGDPAAAARRRRVRGVATVLVAGGLALALGARGGAASCAGGSRRSQQRRGGQRRHIASHRLAGVPELLEEEGDE